MTKPLPSRILSYTTVTDKKETLFTIEFKQNEHGSFSMEKFHVYDGFLELPIGIQHKLINEAMEELGESPGYTGRDKLTSLN